MLRHGISLVLLITNLLKPSARHSSAIGNAVQIASTLDPAAAKTWGRLEAVVPEHLCETEENPSPGRALRLTAKMPDLLVGYLPAVILTAAGRSGTVNGVSNRHSDPARLTLTDSGQVSY